MSEFKKGDRVRLADTLPPPNWREIPCSACGVPAGVHDWEACVMRLATMLDLRPTEDR